MTNLDSVLKSRDISLPTKVYLIKAMVFPVFMYGCESWTIKKAKRRRIDVFELLCWRILLRVPWIARSNQSILKNLLMTVKEDSEEHGLKLSIKNKTKIVASDTIILSFPVLENRTGKKGSSDRL